MAAHDSILNALQSRQEQTDAKQPGDPQQAVERVPDMVRREGWMAGTKKIPLRLVFGSEAMAIVRNQCLETLNDPKEQEDLARSTDFAGAGAVEEYK